MIKLKVKTTDGKLVYITRILEDENKLRMLQSQCQTIYKHFGFYVNVDYLMTEREYSSFDHTITLS